MCKTKTATDAAEPISRTTRPMPKRTPKHQTPIRKSPSLLSDRSTSASANGALSYASGSSYLLDSSVATTSAASGASLSSLRESLPESVHIYDFFEIRSATNNFLAKRYSSTSSSQSWRCKLHNRDVLIFQRKFRRPMEELELKSNLSVICRSHHNSIIGLLGASISGDHIYLVYEYIVGSDLSVCLRNPRNPSFTILSNWMSRMQIADDVARALDYIHSTAGLNINLAHKHVKSSGIVVTEPSFNAKLCHFGAAELCGETEKKALKKGGGEIEEQSPESAPELRRSGSRTRQFEGVRGYISPEFQLTGLATPKSDVYAFGIVLLELFSGEEPVKYKFDKANGEYRKISIIETATYAVGGSGGDGGEGADGRLRRWMDKRLGDSFPVEVAGKIIRVALECVSEDPNKRPDMRRVAGKISKLYLDSRNWSEKHRFPTEISVSLAPR